MGVVATITPSELSCFSCEHFETSDTCVAPVRKHARKLDLGEDLPQEIIGFRFLEHNLVGPARCFCVEHLLSPSLDHECSWSLDSHFRILFLVSATKYLQCVILGSLLPDAKVILLHGFLVIEHPLSFTPQQADWQVDQWHLIKRSHGSNDAGRSTQSFVTFAFQGANCINAFSWQSWHRTKSITSVFVVDPPSNFHPSSFGFRPPSTPCLHLGVHWM